ncbi:hypothetical protein CcaverHIS002_0303550 [Cutaneotrichosporon cavernicola]|uniref:F-box domain-containing protein n=1 Tax=Cutaneotrichosporon cavernicola TaxID=279322 RepID=A0AA48I5Z2_9TREE|nr:uncharacterized protein CcaverHIS019_0303540 [Cutaneotrichosporon cavernicola]BEI82487.1 hypothetical protein CcaverHIS002_0303550 [Cutaneotrichosporon cavernicola]BEI90284.1 hypothetical protein CcaverHIS019_0303540 [Cutaneotrichosporon cavernicola]BEI98060.1 hypothetical protein CcaverHIS631_0303590 [Cutaneotrichosporon cavernicola]BEJ05837.1 hypothetical protein CcaverHIS641_0303590 [Cutaneotrichosporon cavernicola]
MSTTTSLLHTALQNLHVAQQVAHPSHTPRPPSSRSSPPASRRNGDSSDDDEYVPVGHGTAPGTPIPGKGMVLGQRIKKDNGARDPLKNFPTHVAVRIFLQLDIRSLARCDRVCKRWRKSSTLNYIWFLQNRSLQLPALPSAMGGKTRKLDDGTEFFDPYDKGTKLSSLPPVAVPTSNQPQWSKAESKRAWKSVFHTTLARKDADSEEDHPYHVDIDSLHTSGYTTPVRHSHAGMGSGAAARWSDNSGTGGMTPTERKVAAREGYKALGGRKSRTKRRMGGTGARKGPDIEDDDPRFTAPW